MAMNDSEIIACLKKIVDSVGAGAFDNHTRGNALISDFFPGGDNAKTRRLLKSVIDVDAFAKISKAKNNELDTVCKALKSTLMDDESLSEERAELVVGWVCGAYGKRKPSFPKATPIQPQASSHYSGGSYSPVSQPVSKPQPTPKSRPIQTYQPATTSGNTYGINPNYHVKRKRQINKKLLTRIAVLLAAVALFAFVVWPLIIYPNLPNKDLYTPEIVRTYSGTYSGGNASGDAIITIDSCDASGNVKGSFEFVANDVYGKYQISGKIASKKNNGNLVIAVDPGQWEVHPDGFTQLESMEIKIKNQYQTLKCSQYRMNWTYGSNDKYAIKTAEDLTKLNGSSGTYHLRNDIDLGNMQWTPIEGFTGTLMGNGYTIRNLTIEASTSDIGLFATVPGLISNLNIENASVTVTGRNENVGILCGKLGGTVINVSVSGVVDASKCDNVGGVFGFYDRSLNQSYNQPFSAYGITNSASVTGLNKVGGIGGRVYTEWTVVTISESFNRGTIVAEEDYAGGIVGCVTTDNAMGSGSDTCITDCENTGSITGRYYVGGIGGYVKSSGDELSMIDNCVCEASILGQAYVGCIGGAVYYTPISSCENKGSTLTATGNVLIDNKRCAYAGGFAGVGGDFSDCTNEVEINYTGGGSYVGGIVGYGHVSITPKQIALKNISNKANISGADYVGGIAGGFLCEYATLYIEAATNSANISGSGDYVGGIIGFGRATDHDGYVYVYDSDNSGDVTGKSYVGGIMGYGRAYYQDSVISNTTSTGSVKGNAKTGKIAGELTNIKVE